MSTLYALSWGTIQRRNAEEDDSGTMEAVRLEPVEAANVTILVDNAIDILLPSSDVVRRPPLAWEWSRQEQLIAEHGYSLLLEVQKGGRSQSILYDTGLGRETLLHNMDVLG